MAHILLAEDDSGFLEWLTEIMLDAGHQIVTARDGLEARTLAGSQPFDLIVTDISMPNEEGLGLIRALRKAHPDIKILALSGKDPETLYDATLLGAQATLRKPVTSKVILQCIRDLLPLA